MPFATLKHFGARLYRHPVPRIIIATIFSLGKIAASAGSTLFGIRETLESYGVVDPVVQGIANGLTSLNVLITSASRAPPIYRKLLGYSHRKPEDYQVLATKPLPLNPALHLSTRMQVSYYFLVTFGYLSSPFSALNAYLSAITLIDTLCPSMEDAHRIGLANFVTASSMMSYYSFNLKKMRRNTLKCCVVIQQRLHGEPFNIQYRTIAATLLSTVFGVIAGIGTSYLGTTKSLERFPLTQDLTPDTQTTIVITSVIASLFSSTFIYGVSSYDQIKAWLEPSTANRHITAIPYYARVMVLIDSSGGSLLGFIGVVNLIGRLFGLDPNAAIAPSLPSLLNNIVMNYSLGLIGCKGTTKWLRQQSLKLLGSTDPESTPPSPSQRQTLPTLGSATGQLYAYQPCIDPSPSVDDPSPVM